jgi:branched-chain amino acid transport system substrate-binding protein
MQSPEIKKFFDRYVPLAEKQGVDPLGYYVPPFYYVAGQLAAAAITGAGSLDQAAMATWLHGNTVETIVGPASFNEIGDWTKRRVLMVQIQNVKGNDLAQFREAGHQVIVDPPELKSGEFIFPYNKARAS